MAGFLPYCLYAVPPINIAITLNMRYTEISQKIGDLGSALKSKAILSYLNRPDFDKLQLLKLVLQSKTGFEQAMLDAEMKQFLDGLEETQLYTVNYETLLITISTMSESGEADIKNNIFLSSLNLFHKVSTQLTSVMNMLNGTVALEKVQEPQETKVHHIPSKEVSLDKFLKSFPAVAV